jgi:tyrosine-protein kinase Etk/Wzc
MSASHPSSATSGDEQVNLWKLAAVLLRRWRIVAATVIVAMAIGLTVLFVGSDEYVAEAVLVPSTERGGGAGRLIASTQVPPGFASLLAGSGSNQRIIEGVLKSRTMGDSIISRLGIPLEANAPAEAEVRRVLARGTQITHKSDGSVVIQVRDTNPRRAAQIANEFPELTNVIMAALGINVALRKQELLETQLRGAQERLVDSEERLVQFQVTRDAPEIQEQARQTMEAAAALQQQIMEQEIRVAQLRRTATGENPELQAAVASLNMTRSQLSRITSGHGRRDQIFLSLRESPELKAGATRLVREFTKDEQVYLSLTAALVEAQIDANNNLPVVSVLDAAKVPLHPARLPPILVLSVAVLLGFMVGIPAAFLREYAVIARRDPASAQFFAAWEELKSDAQRFVPLRRRSARVPRRG